MNKDAVAGLALAALAGLYWYYADAIPESSLAGQVGADGLPKVLAYILGGLAATLIVRGLMIWRTAPADGSTGAAPGAGPGTAMGPMAANRPGEWYAHARAAGLMLLAIAYIAALPYLGYILAIGLLMFAVALYSGARLSFQLAAIAAAGALLFYILFVRILNIPLPPGIWPGLQ